MVQDPLKVDQIRLEPGSGETLLIQRDSATGAFKFTDNVLQGGILLHQLAGLRSVAGIFVVGLSGAGAAYTTIQAALDDVPVNSSVTNPYLILIGPGVYTETVNIVRDGVILKGLGGVTLRSALEDTPNAAGADHTLIISAANGTVPQSVIVEDVTISNTHNNKACVRVVGTAGSNVGAGQWGIRLKNIHFRPVAAGGNRPVWATSVNTVLVEGGSVTSNTLDLFVGEEVAQLGVVGVYGLGAVSFRWDDAQAAKPSGAARGYMLKDCLSVAQDTALTPLEVTVNGAGAAQFVNCTLPDVTLHGDQHVQFLNCTLGDLTVNDTVQVYLDQTVRGSVNTNADAVLRQGKQTGAVAFDAEASKAVTFPVPQPDDDYFVALELDAAPANDETPWVTNKAATGFTIRFSTAQTLNVGWKAVRTDA